MGRFQGTLGVFPDHDEDPSSENERTFRHRAPRPRRSRQFDREEYREILKDIDGLSDELRTDTEYSRGDETHSYTSTACFPDTDELSDHPADGPSHTRCSSGSRCLTAQYTASSSEAGPLAQPAICKDSAHVRVVPENSNQTDDCSSEFDSPGPLNTDSWGLYSSAPPPKSDNAAPAFEGAPKKHLAEGDGGKAV